jgi:uncharacterized membrane protein YgaE (UPF0421/DUF939 family)
MGAIALGAFLLGFLFWSFDTDPMFAVIAFLLVFDSDMRAAIGDGLTRLWFTVLGTGIALVSIAVFGLHKWLLPLSLVVGALICATFVFARPARRIVLVSVALIVGSSLLEPEQGLQIALTRALEVAVGSLLAIAFSFFVAKLFPPAEPK